MQQDKEHILPNTFIIGAPKSGTSSMASYLGEHPDVFVSDPKEPFFWSDDYPKLKLRFGMTSLDKYLEIYSQDGAARKIRIDGSTNYLASNIAVCNILRHQPNAKFIVMLRNPVEVVQAFHAEVVFSGIETEFNFERAWELQFARQRNPNLNPLYCEAPQFLQYA
ncbi:MAG: sulfotransferase, partial [Planctomycetota bacterium]